MSNLGSSSRGLSHGARRILVAAGAATVLGAGLFGAPALASAPNPDGDQLSNTVTAPNSNCLTGSEAGCVAGPVTVVVPMLDPMVAGATSIALVAAGSGIIAVQRRRQSRTAAPNVEA
ncbi:hypothetical protein H9Y04_45230 [Streptomyces sp. TRM66268-LWL]|uniref:Uncharacterized protein n=1 Tax=Streptomyces polyasparticus TaxID=2767826 RepID=A0ABR7SZ89_9ACTN|nr:hypothetical protein [Streptomyces polyasparticus]MBC9719683.1 hypothetical protein [Streptomyces polyasparticus]